MVRNIIFYKMYIMTLYLFLTMIFKVNRIYDFEPEIPLIHYHLFIFVLYILTCIEILYEFVRFSIVKFLNINYSSCVTVTER